MQISYLVSLEVCKPNEKEREGQVWRLRVLQVVDFLLE